MIGLQTQPTTPAPVTMPRRPSPLRRLLLRVLVVAGVLAVVAGIGWLLLFSPVFGVDRVVVSGASGTLATQVSRQSGVGPGAPLLRVDAGDVARRIVAGVPNLEQVTVTRDWPGTVRVQVTPRRALLAVRTPWEWQVLDHEGAVLATAVERPSGLPKLTDAGSPAAAAAAARVLPELPAKIRSRVESVSAVSPESISVRLQDGRTVVWGSTEDGEKKGRVLKALLSVQARVYDVSAPDLPTTVG